MDLHFTGVLAELTRCANTLDPETPAGFVGGQQPSPWGGYDYARLADSVQWMEAYDINGTGEILRSFWGQDRPRLQTFFSSRDPKQDAWFLWTTLAHGNRGAIAWPEGWFSGGKVADPIRGCSETFREVQSDVSRLIIDGEFLHDPIAVYYSHPSIQASWAMDATVHGASWINRSSSLDDENSVAGLNRLAWLKLLEDLGYQARFVRERDLLGGNLYEKAYRVLVLNHTLALSREEAAAVMAFAEAGGTVLADGGTGLFDEHGKGRPSGVLDSFFGIRQHPEKGLLGGQEVTEIDGERYAEDFRKRLTTGNGLRHQGMVLYGRGVALDGGVSEIQVDGAAALVTKANGKGKSVFLNLSPIEYLPGRREEPGRAWRELVGGILAQADLQPRLTLQQDGVPTAEVESIFWKRGERTVLCVVKNPTRKQGIDPDAMKELSRAQPVKLGLSFAGEVKDLVNEGTGKKLGDGRNFADDWSPWEANIYSFR